jgi:hypothetical protein
MDLNKEIALLLGFKFLEDGQVIYPNNWEDERKCVPCYTIPDFVEMINTCRDIANKFTYGIPTDFRRNKK